MNGESRYVNTPSNEDDFSNYNSHANSMNQRYNSNNCYQDKRYNQKAPNSGHFNGSSLQGFNANNYHGYNGNGGIDPRAFKQFDRERQRFYNSGFHLPHPPSLAQFDRFNGIGSVDPGCNIQNNFYQDRRRPMYRMNGNGRQFAYNCTNHNGSPSSRRRWSNGDESHVPCTNRGGGPAYLNGTQRYRDGSNGGNGQDSGGSNGYEGGSSETQSEPEDRGVLQPVQSIIIDNGKNIFRLKYNCYTSYIILVTHV